MRNRWNDEEAGRHPGLLDECAYGSRLLGSDSNLVLHGGGNTSVKATSVDVTGREVAVLYVKGSGWDLAKIEPAGFAPLRLDRLRELLEVHRLSDAQMMNELRCALLDAKAPDPSVESLLHALLPFPAVQHSHADALVTLTNLDDGEKRIREVCGDSVVVVPYCMPGFDLARLCARLWPEQAHAGTVGMVLLKHGLYTFGASTREAYARHIELISMAEDYLDCNAPLPSTVGTPALPEVSLSELAVLRRRISDAAGTPMIVSRHTDQRIAAFVARDDLATLTQRGPLTPDHVIRTKRVPMLGRDLDAYVREYHAYFAEYESRGRVPLTMLDPAPRVVLDTELGLLTVGRRAKEADIAHDIYRHSMDVLERGQLLGGYQALPAADIFDVEYWELEQAKLRRTGSPPPLAGQVALVTGAASGIGKACARALLDAGASVVGLDVADSVHTALAGPEWLGVPADVTDPPAVAAALRAGVERFGGLDLLVVSAGVFPQSQPIAKLDPSAWRRTMAVNVDSVADLLRACHPLLAQAPAGGRVVLIASKNVPAPGPGAAAYSASKAALTQLARVAALEWAADGIRVNIVHPDAVFDTGLWTDEVLAERARRYGMSVADYKRRNLLGREVTSATVAQMVTQMCGDAFACTTGAQVPVDGGNDRVV
jgi:rhamnose utilization protein RhaD (predicted bifunctional aldolase and dehydrogenase)/NAD(P)-dependent dehydrogenase (short-subunit alcohol dehydrogenase family)